MLSTGEVACFGKNHQKAYLKALSTTGFKIHNKCNVLISVGSYQDKCELFNYIKLLPDNGFTLYGTNGTANYYTESKLQVTGLDNEEVYRRIQDGFFGLVINISIPNKTRQNKKNMVTTRRLSIDYSVDILINIKCVKLYIESIVSYYNSSNLFVIVMLKQQRAILNYLCLLTSMFT